MEQILIGKNLSLATLATTDDIVNLQNGQLAVFDSNGKRVTATSVFKRNEHFFFMLGQATAGEPIMGLVINPFDFKYACTKYKAPIRLKKTIIVDVPTQVQFDAATTSCCMPHPYMYQDVTVKVYIDDNKKAYSDKAIVPTTATAQIGRVYNIPAVLTEIVDSLKDQLEPKGWIVTVVDGNEITLEAPVDTFFNVVGDNIALDSVVTTVTGMTYSVGGAELQSEQEVWDAVKEGYNARFEKSIMVGGEHWGQDWKTIKGEQYDTIVIETKTEYQYELLPNDNKGLWKKQFIVVPKDAAVRDAITGLLDAIGSACGHLADKAGVY